MKGPKWLDSIELVNHESGGYWEQQGWDQNAVVKTTSRFDLPRDGDILKLGPVALYGVAFAGKRGVSKVEYSADAGRNWSQADVKPALSPLTRVVWSATWTPRAWATGLGDRWRRCGSGFQLCTQRSRRRDRVSHDWDRGFACLAVRPTE